MAMRAAIRETLIDVHVEATAWHDSVAGCEALVQRAVRAALDGAGVGGGALEVAVVLSDDAAVAALNGQYRGKPRPTNVLSFQAAPAKALARLHGPAADDGVPVLLGDVILARETVLAEAAQQHKSVQDHLCHLIVHGTLHLLGHDHEDPAEAERMEALERTVLANLGIDDPYQ